CVLAPTQREGTRTRYYTRHTGDVTDTHTHTRTGTHTHTPPNAPPPHTHRHTHTQERARAHAHTQTTYSSTPHKYLGDRSWPSISWSCPWCRTPRILHGG